MINEVTIVGRRVTDRTCIFSNSNGPVIFKKRPNLI